MRADTGRESVYDNPRYYEIAFSFRDIAAEVDVLEQVIARFSRIPVATVLEMGCGHAPHLAELAKRGYQYIGLDLSPAMLGYAQSRADGIHTSARFELADMTDFQLAGQVDFAFVLLGSLQARNTAELVSHFDCVSRALRPGGLYFLHWCVSFASNTDSSESWEMVRGDVKVKASFQTTPVDLVEQVDEESLTLEVEDGSSKRTLRESGRVRRIYPQEFRLFVAAREDCQFVGWWNNWDPAQPLEEVQQIARPIAVLRRVRPGPEAGI